MTANKAPITELRQDEIWRYFQSEGLGSFDGNRRRLALLVRMLQPGSTVLNVGVGNGFFEYLAGKAGHNVHSVDPDQGAIEELTRRLALGDKARVGRSSALPFSDGTFDAVVVSEVLEHLENEELAAALPEIRRVLKPVGRVIGTVPANEDLKLQLVVCPCCATRFHRWGHVQSFDERRLRALLCEWFSVVDIVQRPFAPWDILNWRGKLAALVKFGLYRAGLHGGAENLVFLAARDLDGRVARAMRAGF